MCFAHRGAAAGALGVVVLALALGGCGSGGTSTDSGTTAGVAATTPVTASAPAGMAPRTTATATTPARHPRARVPQHRAVAHPAPARTAPSTPSAQPAPHPQQVASQPRPRKVSRPAGPAAHPIDEKAQLVLVSSPAPGRYEQQGTVTGTFDGTMTLKAHITDAGIVVDFTANVTGGLVIGHGLAIPTIDSRSPVATLNGTASITGGTGVFAHVKASKLKVRGTAVLPSGSKATVRLTGTVTY
jgi:hypothetical protein